MKTTLYLLCAVACCGMLGLAKADINGFGGNGIGWTLNGQNNQSGSLLPGPVPTIARNVLDITDVVIPSNARSAFFGTPQPIAAFRASFTYQNLTALNQGGGFYNPADGMVFTFQNQGRTAIGNPGSSLGYEGIQKASGVAINLWNGHIVGVGYAPTSVGNGSYEYYSVSPVDFLSLNPITVTVSYDGLNLEVDLLDTITGASFSKIFQANIVADVGDGSAYVGFTGATGSGASDQRISNFSFSATLGAKAAANARSVVGFPYLLGGKGFDYDTHEYIMANNIGAGYLYWNAIDKTFEESSGLDCSGLIMWSYNLAAGAMVYQSHANPVYSEGAAGQFSETIPIVDSTIQPGDLLFFYNLDNDKKVDHVAMYVGGPDDKNVIAAPQPGKLIQFYSKAKMQSWQGYYGAHRVTGSNPQLQIINHSPVDLLVTDPDGNVISPSNVQLGVEEILTEIPGELYYSVYDRDAGSQPSAIVSSPKLKIGDYAIQVLPRPTSVPTAVYGLTVQTSHELLTFANELTIQNIPPLGYAFRSDGDSIAQLIPVGICVKPGDAVPSINLAANGSTPVAIFSNKQFDSTHMLNIVSLRLNAAPVSCRPNGTPIVSFQDVNGDGMADLVVAVDTRSMIVKPGDDQVKLEGLTVFGTPIKGTQRVQFVP